LPKYLDEVFAPQEYDTPKSTTRRTCNRRRGKVVDPHLERNFKPNILCIVPPYGSRAPAGTAYLLGYLKAHGCHEFDFLDLRLCAPFDFTPTYRTTGAFGESYVLDIPNLPLVLMMLEAFSRGIAAHNLAV
jgi:hypothetical protein